MSQNLPEGARVDPHDVFLHPDLEADDGEDWEVPSEDSDTSDQ